MPASEDYHEALWEAHPEGLEPVDFARRSDFLLGHAGAGERVLDVGCGEGRFAAELVRAGAEVVGSTLPQSRCGARMSATPSSTCARCPPKGPGR